MCPGQVPSWGDEHGMALGSRQPLSLLCWGAKGAPQPSELSGRSLGVRNT